MRFLFGDTHLFAVYKPANKHSVRTRESAAETAEDSVAEALLKENPKAALISTNPDDGGLVNRLDFETSGVLIGAKSRDIWLKLHELFKNEKVSKFYCALLNGRAPHSSTVGGYIGGVYRGSKKVRVYTKMPYSNSRALPAHSEFKSLSYDRENGITLALIKIRTGRRHQIRAHAKSIGHPILGDSLYGDAAPGEALCLHAWCYEFNHPVGGERICVIASPEDLPWFNTFKNVTLKRF